MPWTTFVAARRHAAKHNPVRATGRASTECVRGSHSVSGTEEDAVYMQGALTLGLEQQAASGERTEKVMGEAPLLHFALGTLELQSIQRLAARDVAALYGH